MIIYIDIDTDHFHWDLSFCSKIKNGMHYKTCARFRAN